MDPFTAFSLLCGIIQVVDFGTKLAKKGRELYKDGAATENMELEEMATCLTGLRTSLDLTDRGSVDEIVHLGTKCSDTAQELVAELEKLKIHGPKRKREVISKTFMTIWKKSAIHDIQKRLDDYRKLLDSRILVDLSKRSDLLALQQSEGFQNLDTKVQTIITNLEKAPLQFDDLKALIQVENGAIKGHITTELQQQRRDLAHEEYRQRFLQSLWYPEIYSRQERVGEAYKKTFQWIYEPYDFDRPTPHWANFVDWLEKGGGIYWISGKAGSGKSTLMNYIHQDNRTRSLLRAWTGEKKILSPGFFFWNAGTTLEKSSEGLLRSLLYQILQKLPNLIPLVIESQSNPVSEEDDIEKCAPIAAWTERRLRATFQNVMRQAQGDCRFCIFIDGLDEINEDPDRLIAMIETMQSADVKLCVSSRADRPYFEAFGLYAMLRLQDLTEPDIKTYVWDRLQPLLPMESACEVSETLNDIVSKAQGVFLWVELVVKTLVQGLKNHDSLKQLQMRVESTPSDIEALYAKMLSNIEFPYHIDAARLLELALANFTHSLLDVSLALYNAFERVPEISLRGALQLCEQTQARIPTICAGFLEVHLEHRDSQEGGGKYRYTDHYLSLPIRYTSSSFLADVSFFERYAHVHFIHRTAVDFFTRNKQGQRFLEANSQSCPSLHSVYVRALLTKVNLLGFPKKPANIEEDFSGIRPCYTDTSYDIFENFTEKVETSYDILENFTEKVATMFVAEIMSTLAWDDFNAGTAQESLCDDVDRILAIVYQRHQVLPSNSHWSARWGFKFRDFGALRDTSVTSWYIRSSRSSTPDSFHSTNSESRLLNSIPIDFLGHAASWCMSCYVLKSLDMRRRHLRKDVDYLLYCSTRTLSGYFFMFDTPKAIDKLLPLVAGLLTRGGNPNMYVEDLSSTIWGLLLRGSTRIVTYSSNCFVATARTFLESGADVHLRIVTQISVPKSRQSQEALQTGSVAEMVFRHEKSVLYIIRSLLARLPEMQALEEIILLKGGCDSHKFTHVFLKKDDYRRRRISDRENKKLIAASSAAGYGYGEDSDKEWALQLGKIYNEISETGRESGSRTHLDEDRSPDADAEEEFHEAVTDQTVADVQD